MKCHSYLSQLSSQIRLFLRLRRAWRTRRTSTSTCTIYAEKSWWEYVSTFFFHFSNLTLKRAENTVSVIFIADEFNLSTLFLRHFQGYFRLQGNSNAYVCSMSSKTIVYKGMLRACDLPLFYKDLTDPRFKTPFAVYHRRFSTNTVPKWFLAQVQILTSMLFCLNACFPYCVEIGAVMTHAALLTHLTSNL